jgi:dipeptide transport system ATP-binding protein
VFSTRCPYAVDRCRVDRPQARLIDERRVACHFADDFLRSGFPEPRASDNQVPSAA